MIRRPPRSTLFPYTTSSDLQIAPYCGHTVMCLHLYNVCTIQTVDQDYHNWRSRPRYTSTGANRRKRKPRYEAGVGEFVRSGVSLQTQTILTSGGLTRKSKVPRLGGV